MGSRAFDPCRSQHCGWADAPAGHPPRGTRLAGSHGYHAGVSGILRWIGQTELTDDQKRKVRAAVRRMYLRRQVRTFAHRAASSAAWLSPPSAVRAPRRRQPAGSDQRKRRPGFTAPFPRWAGLDGVVSGRGDLHTVGGSIRQIGSLRSGVGNRQNVQVRGQRPVGRYAGAHE